MAKNIENKCNSLQYAPFILTLGSIKMSSVQPRLDTPTETMTDLEKFERVQSNQLAATCFFSHWNCEVHPIILQIYRWGYCKQLFIREPHELI